MIDLTLRPPISQDHFSFKSMFQWNNFSLLTCWREQKKLFNSSIIYPSLNSMVFSCLLDSTVLTERQGPYRISTCSWNRRSSRTRYCLQRNCVFATLPMISSSEGSLNHSRYWTNASDHFHLWSDRVSFSKLLRNLLYYVVSVPFRRSILVLYVSLLYVLIPLLKSHSDISTGCSTNLSQWFIFP